MTSQIKSSRTAAGTAGWLLPHRKQFERILSAQGYAPATVRNYDVTIARFCEVAEICASGARELDDRQIGQIRAAVLDGVAPRIRTNTMFCSIALSIISSGQASEGCWSRHRRF
jgi:hypothetical protein